MHERGGGPYDVSLERLEAILAGEPRYRVRQVWEGLYRRCSLPAEMTDLPRPLRQRLAEALPRALEQVWCRESDGGDTLKWLFDLGGGAQIETVLMHYPQRATVCVSSQAGCAMGCTFCATGQGGFTRQLSPGEIIEQVVVAVRRARPRRVSRVVFMGMGEPLANYPAVLTAARRLHDDMGLSARHLTISTVGVVPGIRRLAGEGLAVNLAVSLHAANDDLRDRLVPLNRRYPLGVLMAACDHYRRRTGRRLSFEWALIEGINDRFSDADDLAALARPLGAHVNLIPLNPTPGYPVRGSSQPRVSAFRQALVGRGINVTVRQTRGTSIQAACGQLAASARAGHRVQAPVAG